MNRAQLESDLIVLQEAIECQEKAVTMLRIVVQYTPCDSDSIQMIQFQTERTLLARMYNAKQEITNQLRSN